MRKNLLVITDPVPKPRQTRSDRWKQRPCVMEYRAYADTLRAQAKLQDFVLPESGVEMTFMISMPPSWSKKKRHEMYLQPHRAKPDIDNLIKAVLDSLCAEDCVIWNIKGASKYWSMQGCVRLEAA